VAKRFGEPSANANVFRFNFSTGNFDQIPNPFGAFPALAVGPNGTVWAADSGSADVYQYDNFSGSWGLLVFGFSQIIQAGGDGVWALSGNNIYRFEPSKLSLVPVPGLLASISVGSGGGVWGTNSSHQVFAFSTP